MTVGVLTTCHIQYTWVGVYVFFLFNRTTLQVIVTYLTGALYVHPLWFYKHQHDNRVRSKLFVACQRWWFQWPFWFVPSVPGYLREEDEHKPDPWRNSIERNHMVLHLENEVKTPTIILITLYISVVKPTTCTISQIYFILEQHSTRFGRSLRPKHVECCSKINTNLRYCASGWF